MLSLNCVNMQFGDGLGLCRALLACQVVSPLPNSEFFAHQTGNRAEILGIHQRLLRFFVFVLYFGLEGADAALSVAVGKETSLLASFEAHDGSDWGHPAILVHELGQPPLLTMKYD